MGTYNKCKVVMLPTKDTTEIFLRKSNTEVGDSILFHGEFHHLYILSEEEIKEGDYWLNTVNFEIKQCVKHDCWKDYNKKRDFARKIIASTDPELGKYIDGNNPLKGEFIGIALPQIPQSFISLYIEEYNKGNVIIKVDVELESKIEHDKKPDCMGNFMHQRWYPKINPDNTISIKPLGI